MRLRCRLLLSTETQINSKTLLEDGGYSLVGGKETTTTERTHNRGCVEAVGGVG